MLDQLTIMGATNSRIMAYGGNADRGEQILVRNQSEPIQTTEDLRDYTLVKMLVPGNEGDVAICKSTITGKLLVVKHLKADRHSRRHATEHYLPNEAKILREALKPHPNIVRLFQVDRSWELGRFLLTMEFCSGGDLCDQLRHFRWLSPADMGQEHAILMRTATVRCLVPEIFLLHVFVSLVQALAYIHHGLRRTSEGRYIRDENHQPVVHCDIKPDNILLRWRIGDRYQVLPDVVLADFGAASLASECIGIAGTVGYDSPEVMDMYALKFTQPEYYLWAKKFAPRIMTPKSDIYQLGHVTYGIAAMKLWKVGTDPRRASFAEKYSGDGMRLLQAITRRCFEVNPHARPSAGDRSGFLAATERLLQHRDRLAEQRGPLPRTAWKQPPSPY